MRALFAAALLCAAPAWAVSQCGGQVDSCQCNAPNPYPCCDNGGNCTWWAWEAACCHWGVGLPGWGNANQWVGHANTNASYAVHTFPTVGAVACRTLGTYGHVAYVEGLNSGGGVHVSEENCWGNYGLDYANFSSGFFQGFITRASAVQCAPGDTQAQGCGSCGTQSRGCGNDGKWAAWGACSAQGECAPQSTQTEACGACGQRERSCSSTCKWGAWPEACEGPDPDAGTIACESGQAGACAPAVLRCVHGELQCPAQIQPTAEVCGDGIDNNCDGTTDERCTVEHALPPAPPSVDRASAPQPPVIGGCASAPGLSIALLLYVVTRTASSGRRRR